MLRRINLSGAIIVLACFFMPWVQVSCAGATDALSGVDLARSDHTLLWLIPLLMVAVVSMALLRAWKETPRAVGITSAICGAVVIFLMNRERMRVQDEANLISAQLTGWFWLGFLAAAAVVGTALLMLAQKQRAP
jgi:hypothetical protein